MVVGMAFITMVMSMLMKRRMKIVIIHNVITYFWLYNVSKSQSTMHIGCVSNDAA